MCPIAATIKKTSGGTIKGQQWYGLGTRAPISYHSVLFFVSNHNVSASTFTELMLWPNQDNDLTYVCESNTSLPCIY